MPAYVRVKTMGLWPAALSDKGRDRMFSKPVVFIVGAGAGKDYGLPLGGALASTIASDLRKLNRLIGGDNDLVDVLLSSRGRDSLPKYIEAGRMLGAAISSSVSIDDALYLLSESPEAVELGKICISRSILEAEGNGALQIRRDTGRMNPDAGKDGWIEQVFSMAIANHKLCEVSRAFDNLTFINFNYDRCLEHYLFWSLQRIGLPVSDAINIVRGLSIVRPYGTLGTILPRAPDTLQFGELNRLEVFMAKDRIRTYTESEALNKDHLRRVISDAAMHIFLGFGFHHQNLELLSVLESMPVRNGAKQVLATVFGIDPANIDQLRLSLQAIVKVHAERIELLDKTATQLLRDLRLRIMMAVG